jgi:hypothetical protein
MQLHLTRRIFNKNFTIGDLYVDGIWFAYCLEDPVRNGRKIKGQTAIPEGDYKVVLDYSNRFKKIMPHILDVPNFEGIRIHSGNTAEDTEGCILVGQLGLKDSIGESRRAFDALYAVLTAVNSAITLKIKKVELL